MYLSIYLFGSACVCAKSLNHVFSPTWEGPKGLCSSEAQTHSLGIALHVLLYKYHVLTYCATGAPSCAQTGHEHSALMNEISILIIETPESSLAPSTLWGHSGKSATWPRALTCPCGYPGLGLPASGSVRNTFVLFPRQPVCRTLSQQPEQTEASAKDKSIETAGWGILYSIRYEPDMFLSFFKIN